MEPPKNRSIGRSFRINEKLLNVLNSEAERNGLNPNALLNKILKDYSEYHRYTKRYGIISLSKMSLSKIIEACPRECVQETAKEIASIVSIDLFRVMGYSFSKEDAAFMINVVLAEHANWFSCEHHASGQKEFYHLQHALGGKWSVYIAEVVSAIIERCYGKKPKREFLNDTAVTLIIPTINL